MKHWNGTFDVSLSWDPQRQAYFFLLAHTRQDGTREYFKMVPAQTTRHGMINVDDDDDMKLLEKGPAHQLLLAFVTEASKHGIQPNGADQIAKTRHLEDMRKIAFHKIGCDKPT